MTTKEARDFTLNHIEGHAVRLSDYRHRKAVVVFAAKDTGKQAKEITQTLRERFGHEQLPILLVIDISGLPRVMQRVATSLLKKGYKEAVEAAREDYAAKGRPFPADPRDAVIMLPDIDGSVTANFDVGDANAAAVAVLVDEEGGIAGTASGAGAGGRILELLGREGHTLG